MFGVTCDNSGCTDPRCSAGSVKRRQDRSAAALREAGIEPEIAEEKELDQELADEDDECEYTAGIIRAREREDSVAVVASHSQVVEAFERVCDALVPLDYDGRVRVMKAAGIILGLE